MIGGGIFAVLGVVAQITHAATWFAFLLAGMVALCAGYSYNRLNDISDDRGGSVTFIQVFLGNTTAAGIIGWTQLFGYIGSMVSYAYAFGSYTVGFRIIPETVVGISLRPLVAVAVVGGFVALNLLDARATGSTENIMVGVKMIILFALGVGGLYYGYRHQQLDFGFVQLATFHPVMAAAISFVAFQGWQLLYFDQESIASPTQTIRRAVYIAIPSAILIYILVEVTAVSLAPMDVLKHHPERALAVAASPVIPFGFTIISLAALFSTGSAINATLFSSAYLAKGMLSEDLLPERVGDSSEQGLPSRTVIWLGVLTAGLSAYGSLGAITSFASHAFIILFGTVCSLAFLQRNREMVNPVVPALGTLGAIVFFVLMLWHLFQSEPRTFYSVLIISVPVLAVELLYFERNLTQKELGTVEEIVEETNEFVDWTGSSIHSCFF